MTETQAGQANAGATSRRNRHNTASKVVMLLNELAARGEGIGVRELARDLGIDKSAISRLFEQLVELGIAEQDELSGRFRVGPALFALAATVHGRDSLWQAAEPIVRELASTFNETCYLTVRDGNEVIFRDKVDCTHRIRYVIDPGERMPLHAGAGGRAVLCGLDQDEVADFAKHSGLSAITSRTLVDPDALLATVASDRLRGYSVSRGERVPSGGAVAAPYFDATGRCVGSIAYTCPDERYDPAEEAEIGAAVRAAGQALSRRLGHDTADGAPH